MPEDPPKTFWGANIGTALVIGTMLVTIGINYQSLVSANERHDKAIEALGGELRASISLGTAGSHADLEGLRTDFEKYVADHAATGRERLQANTEAQTRLGTQIGAVAKDVNDNARKLDQHEFRITNTEAQQNRLNNALERLSSKIESLDRNVALLVDRLGIKPANDIAPEKQP
jgi:peptidoglycan hydrolase CwlO-like protein